MKASMQVEPEWTTRKGAQRLSGLSRATIDRAVAQKKIESTKMGRTRLVNIASLRAWIASDEWLVRN